MSKNDGLQRYCCVQISTVLSKHGARGLSPFCFSLHLFVLAPQRHPSAEGTRKSPGNANANGGAGGLGSQAALGLNSRTPVQANATDETRKACHPPVGA